LIEGSTWLLVADLQVIFSLQLLSSAGHVLGHLLPSVQFDFRHELEVLNGLELSLCLMEAPA
jgi:hypothetical protein